MKRYFVLFNLLILLTLSLSAQSGKTVYEFLELPFYSHNAALGGVNASLADDGINGAMANPSLLSDETDNQLAVNYTNYLSDVNAGSIAYGRNWKGNMFGVGIQYMNYGTFQGTDEYNQSTGTFTANDFAMSFMYAKQLEPKWQVGLAFKPIYSAYESYTSFGLGVDLGASYVNKETGVNVGFAMTNIGRQITSYADNETGSLPFNTVLSFSKKFAHAPLRVYATADHLHEWDLKYTNTITTSTLTGTDTAKVGFVDMLFRHTVFGLDFVPTKNFYLTVSYNHRRAKELGLSDLKTIAGFSFGGGIKISKFQLGFAASQYQKGIMSYQFSVSTSLNSFKL